MAVGRGVSMSGKMLGSRNRTIFLQAADELRCELRDLLWIFSKGASVDDRVRGVVVHVSVWSEDPVDACGAGFDRDILSDFVCELWVARSAYSHRRREVCSFIETHAAARLEISANQQWDPGLPLQCIQDHGRGISPGAESRRHHFAEPNGGLE